MDLSQTIVQLNKYPTDRYNVLVPVTTMQVASNLQRITVSEVQLDTRQDSSNHGPSKDIYFERSSGAFAITKVAGMKLAAAANISIVDTQPGRTEGCQRCIEMARATGKPRVCGNCEHVHDVAVTVTIRVPEPSGGFRMMKATKEIDCTLEASGMKDGINGQQYRRFLPHRTAMAESKAFMRAIRAALGLAGTYSLEDLKKPFVVARVVPNLDAPEIKQAVASSYLQSMGMLFEMPGHAAPAALPTAQEAEVIPPYDDEAPGQMPWPEAPEEPEDSWSREPQYNGPPAWEEPPEAPEPPQGIYCADCHRQITGGQARSGRKWTPEDIAGYEDLMKVYNEAKAADEAMGDPAAELSELDREERKHRELADQAPRLAAAEAKVEEIAASIQAAEKTIQDAEKRSLEIDAERAALGLAVMEYQRAQQTIEIEEPIAAHLADCQAAGATADALAPQLERLRSEIDDLTNKVLAAHQEAEEIRQRAPKAQGNPEGLRAILNSRRKEVTDRATRRGTIKAKLDAISEAEVQTAQLRREVEEAAASLNDYRDLTADDGLKDYGSCLDKVTMLTADEYRATRDLHPAPEHWRWLITPDGTPASSGTSYVRYVISDGSLYYNSACSGDRGVRPALTLKSDLLVSVPGTEDGSEEAMTPEQREMALYEAAVEKFGEIAQIDQATEEMAELIVALNKYKRYVNFRQGDKEEILAHIAEERADVEIMLNQLHVIFGDNTEKELEKLEHLSELVGMEGSL